MPTHDPRRQLKHTRPVDSEDEGEAPATTTVESTGKSFKRPKKIDIEDSVLNAKVSSNYPQGLVPGDSVKAKRALGDGPAPTLFTLPQELQDIIFLFAFPTVEGVQILSHMNPTEIMEFDVESDEDEDELWSLELEEVNAISKSRREITESGKYKVDEWMVSKTFLVAAARAHFENNTVRVPEIHLIQYYRLALVKAFARHLTISASVIKSGGAECFGYFKVLTIEFSSWDLPHVRNKHRAGFAGMRELEDAMGGPLHGETEADFERFYRDAGLQHSRSLLEVSCVLIPHNAGALLRARDKLCIPVVQQLQGYLKERILRQKREEGHLEAEEILYPASQVLRTPRAKVLTEWQAHELWEEANGIL